MPAEGGTSDFLLAVEIGELSKLEALAGHLNAIREAARTPVTYTINVRAPGLKEVAEQLNRARTQETGPGAAGGRGGAGPSSGAINELRQTLNKLNTYISGDLRNALNGLTSAVKEIRSVGGDDVVGGAGIIQAIDQLNETLRRSLLNAVRQGPDVPEGRAVREAATYRRAAEASDLQQILRLIKDPTVVGAERQRVTAAAYDLVRRGGRSQEQVDRALALREQRRAELLKRYPETDLSGSRRALLRSGFVGVGAGDKLLKDLKLNADQIKRVMDAYITSQNDLAQRLEGQVKTVVGYTVRRPGTPGAPKTINPSDILAGLQVPDEKSVVRRLLDRAKVLRDEAAEAQRKAEEALRSPTVPRGPGGTFIPREAVAGLYQRQARRSLQEAKVLETSALSEIEKQVETDAGLRKNAADARERAAAVKRQLQAFGNEFSAVLPSDLLNDTNKLLRKFKNELTKVAKELEKAPGSLSAADVRTRFSRFLSNPIIGTLFDPAVGEGAAEYRGARSELEQRRLDLNNLIEARGGIRGQTNVDRVQRVLDRATNRRLALEAQLAAPRKPKAEDRDRLERLKDDLDKASNLYFRSRQWERDLTKDIQRETDPEVRAQYEQDLVGLQQRTEARRLVVEKLRGQFEAEEVRLRKQNRPRKPTKAEQQLLEQVVEAEERARTRLQSLRATEPAPELIAAARAKVEEAQQRVYGLEAKAGGLSLSDQVGIQDALKQLPELQQALEPLRAFAKEYRGERTPTRRDFPKFNPISGVYTVVEDAEGLARVEVDPKRERRALRAYRQGLTFQPFPQQALATLQTEMEAQLAALGGTTDPQERKKLDASINRLARAIDVGGEWFFAGREGQIPFRGFDILRDVRFAKQGLPPEQVADFEKRFAAFGVGAGAAVPPEVLGVLQQLLNLPQGGAANPLVQAKLFEQLAGVDLGRLTGGLREFGLALQQVVSLMRQAGGTGSVAVKQAIDEARRTGQTAFEQGRVARQKEVINARAEKTQETEAVRGIERRKNIQFAADEKIRVAQERGRLTGRRGGAAVLSLGDRLAGLGLPDFTGTNIGRQGAGLFSQLQRTMGRIAGLEEELVHNQALAQASLIEADRRPIVQRGTRIAQELDVRRVELNALTQSILQDPAFRRSFAEFEERRAAHTLPRRIQEQALDEPLDRLVAEQKRATAQFDRLHNLFQNFTRTREAFNEAFRTGNVAEARRLGPAYRQARQALVDAGFGGSVRAGRYQNIDLDRLGEAQGQARTQVDTATGAVVRQTSAWAQWVKQLKTTPPYVEGLINKFRSLSQYLVGGFVLYGVISLFSRLTREVISLESELAKIRGIFPNRGLSDILLIEDGAVKAAQEYGASLRETIQLTKTFAQLGLTPEAALRETRATLLAARGAGIEPQQAVEALVAVRNLSDERISSEDILDRISRIEARNAVTAQDLSIALQRVGSLAVQLQPERLGFIDAFDTVIAATTQIVEKTRVTGNQAATSLRFIFARLTAPEIAGKLQRQFGIRLAANEEGTELRPLLDILGDIATQYQEFTRTGETVKAAQLLQTVAGARQINAAAALFSDFNKVLETATESSTAFGDTQARLALQQETLEFKLAKLGAAATAAYSALLRGTGALGGFKFIIDGLSSALNLAGGNRAAEYSGPLTTGIAGALGVGLFAGLGKLGTISSRALNAGKLGAFGNALALIGSAASRINPVIALITAILGLLTVTGGLRSLGRLFSNAEERERFGARALTREQILGSQLGQRFGEQAAALGVSTGIAYDAVRRAVAAARQAVADQFGRDVFGPGYTPTEADRGSRELFQETFLNTLSASLQGIASIEDPAQRTATALELLRTSAQLAGGALSLQQQYLTNQLNEFIQRIGERFVEAQPAPGVTGFRGLFTTPFYRQAAQQTNRATAGLAFTQTLGQEFTDAFGGLSFPFLKRIDEEMGGAAINFSTALDKAAAEFLVLDNTTQALVQRIETELREQGLTGEDFEHALRDRLRGQGQFEALRIFENQREFEDVLARALFAKFDIAERVGITKEAAGDLFSQGDGATGAGRAQLVQRIQAAADRILKLLSTQAQTPQVQEITEAVKQLSNPLTAERFAARIQDTERVRPGRDYALEVLAQYLRRQDEIRFGERELRAAGIGVDTAQARADAAREALQGIGTVRARLESDLLQALQGFGQISDLFELPLPTDREDTGRQVASRIEESLGSALESVRGQDRDRLTARIRGVSASLDELLLNTPLIGKLGDSFGKEVQTLTERIREALEGAVPDVKLATLTFVQLLSTFRLAARSTQQTLAARREREQLAEFGRRREERQLEFAQELREISTGQTFARQGAVLGLSQLPLRIRAAQLETVSRFERARLVERQARARAFEEFGPRGRTPSDLQLDAALREAERTHALEEQLALARERVDIERLLNEKTTELLTERTEAARGLSQSALSGLRDVLRGGYDSLRGSDRTGRQGVSGRQLIERIVVPFAETINDRLADNFIDSLIGPQGIFGGLNSLFAQDLLQEQQLLREHRELEREAIRAGARQGILDAFINAPSPIASPGPRNPLAATERPPLTANIPQWRPDITELSGSPTKLSPIVITARRPGSVGTSGGGGAGGWEGTTQPSIISRMFRWFIGAGPRRTLAPTAIDSLDPRVRGEFEALVGEVQKQFPGARVTSAFRTQAEQDALRAAGRTTAQRSYHTLGQAIDLGGLSSAEEREQVAELARARGYRALVEADHVHVTRPISQQLLGPGTVPLSKLFSRLTDPKLPKREFPELMKRPFVKDTLRGGIDYGYLFGPSNVRTLSPSVDVKKLRDGVLGQYNPALGTIKLSPDVVRAGAGARAGGVQRADFDFVLAHELGHAYNQKLRNKDPDFYLDFIRRFGRDNAPSQTFPDPYSATSGAEERFAQAYANAIETLRVTQQQTPTEILAEMVQRNREHPGTQMVARYLLQNEKIYAQHPARQFIDAWRQSEGVINTSYANRLFPVRSNDLVQRYSTDIVSPVAYRDPIDELIAPYIPPVGVRDPIDVVRPKVPVPTVDTETLAKSEAQLLRERLQAEQRQRVLEQLSAQAGVLLGGYVGGSLFGRNRGYNYAGVGASFGTAVAPLLLAGLGPAGPLIGGLAGGLLGGLFKRPKPEQPVEYAQAERIEANTREAVTAIENQTRVLLDLDERLLNIPASFVLPQYRPFNFGAAPAQTGGNTYNFTIDARGVSGVDELADKVAARVIGQSDRVGQFFTLR